MGRVVNATPRPLYPQDRPGTLCIGGWVGLRAGLDGYEKFGSPPEFDPRTVQPVASRYVDLKTRTYFDASVHQLQVVLLLYQSYMPVKMQSISTHLRC
jgi:hypothetical protein